ncbi:metal ABC transporter solute-binding protein, Zn/Mn family [Veillonella criceti]|uniref:Probable zinc transport system zinc-binding lipoprotein AdcA n=1 Tax=Veillonella criceti TaxID=103891 RepID=A0A380NI33_9FIRM|nr:zinc ABC transporter substrate-binding protein [Veillonella criceti]SUP40213.1 Probable zinc transport system zinc-binding lipoprotein AdcA precursor [Veillonella criceti]
MKKWRTIGLTAVLAVGVVLGSVLLGGCGSNSTESTKNGLAVVTTVYPAYDIAKQVGGDKVNVTMLVPPGTEPHDWEPTVNDLKAVGKAKLFIYNGAGLEPTEKLLAADIIKEAKPVELSSVVDVLPSATTSLDSETEAMHHSHEGNGAEAHHHELGAKPIAGEHEHHHDTVDPHVWLNPMNVAKEVDLVVKAFSEADPANKEYYEANGKAYKEKLIALDTAYHTFASQVATKELVVTHEAFGYLAKQYGFTQLGIMGVAPDAEPTPERMASIISFVKAHKVQAIFSEALVNPKLANAIAGETGAKVYMLNPVEGLTEEQMKAGENYLTIMTQNLTVLREALGVN